MTKKKPKPADGLDTLDRVTMLLVTLANRSDVEDACRQELGLTAEETSRLIDLAGVRIQGVATYDRDAQLGSAILRLNDLYQRALTIQDVKTALAAQRELNKLLDLYRRRPATPAKPAETPSPAGEPFQRIKLHSTG